MMTWMSFVFILLAILLNGIFILMGVWIGYKAGKGSDIVRGMPSDLEPIPMEGDARLVYDDDDEDDDDEE